MVCPSVQPRLSLRPETFAAFRICFCLSAIALGNSFVEFRGRLELCVTEAKANPSEANGEDVYEVAKIGEFRFVSGFPGFIFQT